ncbi:hypothetical protein IKT18_03450 [Candidatus Saccharibacteria bacterium]|nr:hypothetical protein [Candidatus Saccharibacteria bacterium]
MSYIFPVIFFIVSMVIFCFLQIPSGVFSMFYHFRLAKTSKKQADDATLSFILGVEIFNTIMWLLTYIIIFCCQSSSISPFFLWLMTGICLADAVAAFFFYFRKSKSSTATFISRRVAKSLASRAKTVSSRSDAITLGFVSCLPELLFTLPLYITCSAFLQSENALPRAILIIVAVIIAVVPLFVIRTFFRTDHNLAEIQRLRVKLKPHFRIILSLAYIAATITLMNLAIINM